MPPLIKQGDSLDSVWEELIFTQAALAAHPDAADQETAIAPLVAEWDDIHRKERSHWSAQIRAQAVCVICDGELDAGAKKLSSIILGLVNSNRKSPRYLRYF